MGWDGWRVIYCTITTGYHGNITYVILGLYVLCRFTVILCYIFIFNISLIMWPEDERWRDQVLSEFIFIIIRHKCIVRSQTQCVKNNVHWYHYYVNDLGYILGQYVNYDCCFQSQYQRQICIQIPGASLPELNNYSAKLPGWICFVVK